VREFDSIIIGFGKGGKTLAGFQAKRGEKVALIERSSMMYGGTCINVGCIPSKSLETSARLSHEIGGTFAEKEQRYAQAIAGKRALTAALRGKNHDMVANAGAEVLDGVASFIDPHTVEIRYADGTAEQLYGKRIFLNTGSTPFLPPIAGLKDSSRVFVSETLMDLDALPEHLVIIGGGYIGLEFASYYNNFGSDVTILQDLEAFIPREDADISAAVLKQMTDRGIHIVRGAKVTEIRPGADHDEVLAETAEGAQSYPADAILVATGRRAAVADLNPAAAGIALTSRGEIETDEHLKTSQDHIYAMGDVKGGLQFTYISLDDFRIVKSALYQDGSRTTANRGAIPYVVFLDPPMARVGLSEAEARDKGYHVLTGKLPAMNIPKAKVLKKTDGLLKVIIDGDTHQILGAHLFCAESHELINQIKMAMDAKIPYETLRDAIYTHPTMSEAFNDLFANVA